jgi:hypothetical protein
MQGQTQQRPRARQPAASVLSPAAAQRLWCAPAPAPDPTLRTGGELDPAAGRPGSRCSRCSCRRRHPPSAAFQKRRPPLLTSEPSSRTPLSRKFMASRSLSNDSLSCSCSRVTLKLLPPNTFWSSTPAEGRQRPGAGLRLPPPPGGARAAAGRPLRLGTSYAWGGAPQSSGGGAG